MTRFGRFLPSLVVLACISGCRTVPIPASFDAIQVPPGLSAQEVEVAIFSGIYNKHPPASYDPTKPLSGEDFDRFIWENYLSAGRTRSWFPESRKPGTVIAAVDTRGHYLEVALAFDTATIQTELIQSKNLQQENGQIHRKVIAWIDNLHEHIRRELNRLATLQRLETPPWTKPG